MTALSADGKRAMTASKYDRATVWDVNTGNALGDIPLAGSRIKRGLRFTAARFSNDGSQLLTGRPDQIVQLWDIATMSEIKRWALPKREGWKPTGATVLDVAFASDGYLAIAANGFVHRLK